MQWQQEILFLTTGFFLAFFISCLLREKILNLITKSGFVRPNFKKEDIPLGAGVIFFITTLIITLPLFFLWTEDKCNNVILILFAMAAFTSLGLMDDFWGTRESSGLLGHFRALLKGNLTTGTIKALGGGILALILGTQLYPDNLLRIIDSSLIIALSVNMVNLFDLRPGRAGKIYILLYLILLPAALDNPEAIIATIVLGSLVAFLPADLKARAMMGDAGANTLGVVVGITAAASLEGYFRTGYLIALVLIHILTERYSLTRIISRNTVLNYLDMLGREKEPNR